MKDNNVVVIKMVIKLDKYRWGWRYAKQIISEHVNSN